MAGHTDPAGPPDRRRSMLIGALIAVAVVAAVVLMRSPTTPSAKPAAAPTQQSVAVLPDQPDSKDRPTTPSSTAQVKTEQTSGSFLGLRWHKSSVTVTAGGSVATASALGIGAGGAISEWADLTAPCFAITSSQSLNGTASGDPTLDVSVRDMVATIEVAWPNDSPTQTITVTLTRCPAGTPSERPEGGATPVPRASGGMRPIGTHAATTSEQPAVGHVFQHHPSGG